MSATNEIVCEVVYALPTRCWQRRLTLRAGSTANDALLAFLRDVTDAPPIDTHHGIGIFGKPCEPLRVLRDGDRVEIYRALLVDPMQERRERAKRAR